MSENALERVRLVCLSMPAVTERLSHGAPTWFVGVRPSFVMYHDDHHGDGRLALWCAAPPGAQASHVGSAPVQFFVPPYVGHRGWVGLRLDRQPDWGEVAEVIEDAYRTVAPRRLVAQLETTSDRLPDG